MRTRVLAMLAACLLAISMGGMSLDTASAAVTEGRFLVQCGGPVRSAPDDPILYPRVYGTAHQHEFYGSRSISPVASYTTMTRSSTACADDRLGYERGDTTSYWHPTLYYRNVRTPAKRSTFYYTNRSKKAPGTMRTWPAGLKIIAGDMHAMAPQSTNIVYWGCGDGGSASGMNAPPQCRTGDTGLTAHVIMPDCWDGQHLDSADHKSHMSYSTKGLCDSRHPVSLPYLIMRFEWTGFYPRPTDLRLSSGSTLTFHADWWNTWHQARLQQLTNYCVNGGRQCSYDDRNNLPFPGSK